MNNRDKLITALEKRGYVNSDLVSEIEAIYGFISVSEQEPPHGVELIAKSPTGVVHLTSWRPAYNIFCCQSKQDSSYDWEWKRI